MSHWRTFVPPSFQPSSRSTAKFIPTIPIIPTPTPPQVIYEAVLLAGEETGEEIMVGSVAGGGRSGNSALRLTFLILLKILSETHDMKHN